MYKVKKGDTILKEKIFNYRKITCYALCWFRRKEDSEGRRREKREK